MNYLGLGKRIRMHRRSLHMTQEQLAEQCGISVSFLGHVERGTRKASLETLVALSNVLHVSPSMLLQDSLIVPDDPSYPSPRQRELINEISRVILENYDK